MPRVKTIQAMVRNPGCRTSGSPAHLGPRITEAIQKPGPVPAPRYPSPNVRRPLATTKRGTRREKTPARPPPPTGAARQPETQRGRITASPDYRTGRKTLRRGPCQRRFEIGQGRAVIGLFAEFAGGAIRLAPHAPAAAPIESPHDTRAWPAGERWLRIRRGSIRPGETAELPAVPFPPRHMPGINVDSVGRLQDDPPRRADFSLAGNRACQKQGKHFAP